MSGVAATLALSRGGVKAWAASSSASIPVLFGVDYYPDQTPEALWTEDARMIAEAGFTNVRIAEFAWDLMEPEEGKY